MRINHKKHKFSAPLVGIMAPCNNKAELLNTIAAKPITRTSTQPTKDEKHWEFMENRRESHLNTLFNRRKTVLQSISKKNRQIYHRIQNQQSIYQNKIHLQKTSDKPPSESITKASRILLALSKQALALSRIPNAQSRLQECESQKVEKQNEKKCDLIARSQGFRQYSIKESPLETIEQYPKGKVVESRLLQNFTTRMHQTKSQQLDYPKTRAHSVGRKRLQDVFLNF